MLKVYTGYNLSNIDDAVSINVTDLTLPSNIINKVTAIVNESNCFSENSTILKIKSNHPLVLATLETLAMESGFNNNMIYYYLDEHGNYSSSHYEGELIIGDYFQNEELMELKTRFYRHFYQTMRKTDHKD